VALSVPDNQKQLVVEVFSAFVQSLTFCVANVADMTGRQIRGLLLHR